MRYKFIWYPVWLLLSACLFFFENNTGSKIILLSSLLLPLVPEIRKWLFQQDDERRIIADAEKSLKTGPAAEEQEAGEIRAYLPGDPINRIHWKLSSKHDELLIREEMMDRTGEASERKERLHQDVSQEARKKRALCFCLIAAGLSLILLFVIAPARFGLLTLINRLFAASEAVNAYAYEYFPVPDDSPTVLTFFLASTAALSLMLIILLSGSRMAALFCETGFILFQIYFGVAFPAWINVALFTLLVLWSLQRPLTKRKTAVSCGVILTAALAVMLFLPGTNVAVEEASERVRDKLGEMAFQISGMMQELPAGENETRHVHSQSLISGLGEAATDREYRLVTVEEEQISLPHWINYLKIAILLLLSSAMVILPFLPFLLLNAHKKKIAKIRESFHSTNVSEAIKDIFQRVISWLEATDNDAGNLPYTEWTKTVSNAITPEYASRFDNCARLFEEAAYSNHPMREEQRLQVMSLLEETEGALGSTIGWMKKLRLKYIECLWI